MSPDELANQRHNRVRELILRTTCQVYPNPIDSELLRATLANLGYPMDGDDLCFYLSYLQERGYVRIDEKRQFRIRMVAITARGIDALDRRIEDCAIGCGEM